MEVVPIVAPGGWRVSGPADTACDTFREERTGVTAVATDGELTSIAGTAEAGRSVGFESGGRRHERHVAVAAERELPAEAWEAARRLAVEASAAARALDPRVGEARATARCIEQRVSVVDAGGRSIEDV